MASRPAGVYTSPIPEQGRVLPAAQQPVPETGFFENLSAGFEEMRLVGNTYAEENRLSSGYGDLIERVNADLPADQHFSDVARRQSIYPWEYEQRIFDAIAARRQRDPNYLQGVPATAFEYREMLRQRAAVRLQELRRVQGGATGMGQIGGFLGSVGGGMTDAANISLMVMIPGGGARTVLGALAREGVENALAETILLPGTNQNYANLGEEQSAGDNLRQVLFAGVGGAAFRGGQIAVTRGVGAAYDRILPQIFNALPDSVQQRWASAATVQDIPLTDILRATVPQDTWTPELRGSVNVAEREAEIASASPFEPTPAGDRAHADNLAVALQRLVDGARTADAVPVEAPAFRPAPQAAAPAPVSSSPTAAVDFKARVRQRESGGNDRISNPQPGQTASGRYQFTHDTFVSLHRQVFGGSMGAEQRWAQRFDGNVQERLMDAAIAGYERVLTRAGQPVTPGNLYLSHFFGPNDAAAILRQPNRPLRDILAERHSARYADQVFSVNPNLRRDMTGADAAALTNRAMGGRAPERTAQTDQPAPAIASDGSAAEIADLEARLAARDSAEPVPGLREHEEGESAFDQPAVLRRDMFASDREWAEAQQHINDGSLRRVGARDDARTVLADAGGIRDDEGHNLLSGRNLQRFVPRAGPLIRRNGMSIDEAGELLWDKGFFGPPETTPRPSTAQVLDLIERASNERVYTPEMAADAELLNLQQRAPREDDLLAEVVAEIRATMLDDYDLPADPEYRSLVAKHYGSGESAWGAVERATDEQQLAGIYEIRARSENPDYDITSFDVDEITAGRSGRETGKGGGRSEPDAGFAGEGSGASRSSSTDAALRNLRGGAASGALLDVPTLRQFDDPAGGAIRSVSDSLEHDLKASLAENPAIAAQKFLVDEIGQEATLDAILDELDADRAAAAAIRGCL